MKQDSFSVEDHKPFAVKLENGVRVAVTFSSTYTAVEPGDDVKSQMLTICILRPLNNHYPKVPFTGVTIQHPKDMYDDGIAQKTALRRACAGLVMFNHKVEVSTKIAAAYAFGLTLRALEKEADHLMRYIWRELKDQFHFHMREFSQEKEPEVEPENKPPEEITDVGF